MEQTKMLELNKKCWDVVAPYFFQVDSLPKYGPYTVSEDEIHLFDTIKNKKVLDIGCGSGHSLAYMAKHGAQELWGVDLSSIQIETAKQILKEWNPHLICAAMEKETDIPKGHFDIVYSIYALGWTSDLSKTLELIYSYLKKGGSFVFSWEHPIYSNLKYGTPEIVLESSYHEEVPITFQTFKGEDVQAVLYKRKLSTYINELLKAGFTIERIVEGEPSSDFDAQTVEPSVKYYSLYKARMLPTTLIVKARK
ncbi:class I SAM-dependent methyltransferase [Bacillus pseudomycoides]|uniref:class I SAM-dependent methyltransferase n=1 Tax=Bacillus pseudomycoides TaxID=64104 RepID=UPI000BEDAC60|nr:class I SAM-dependent methyltransferase [Bacillus pseudomycoides]PEE44619.1 SAM-dependent methyltransferase [Bacillus pseudomycoides]PEI84735.1 SAM-dependent methyltransferase [Bacillus pseudomycoides]PGA89059.1 SAM-dependent methyltransferase [Bacillus pseudomycoides]PHF46721.1 SAM-dependent methyltransferase [Bacillus pseudomycoides]